jgi:hypothetical protein
MYILKNRAKLLGGVIALLVANMPSQAGTPNTGTLEDAAPLQPMLGPYPSLADYVKTLNPDNNCDLDAGSDVVSTKPLAGPYQEVRTFAVGYCGSGHYGRTHLLGVRLGNGWYVRPADVWPETIDHYIFASQIKTIELAVRDIGGAKRIIWRYQGHLTNEYRYESRLVSRAAR